jgi:phosphoglycerate dehydrogenase-like enzyme
MERAMSQPHILVNLPPGFFNCPALAAAWARLATLGEVRQRSWNTPEEIREDLAWAESILMWSWPRLDEALLAAAPKLRFSTHIDVTQAAARAALARGLPLSVSRSGFSPAVAEMALTLTLNVLRRVSDYHAAMRTGGEKWVAAFPDDIDPLERQLTGRRVGIVGLGAIGRRLVELLGPFHCEVRATDPFVSAEAMSALGVRKAELDEMLRASEIVVLAAAANAGTRHLLGAREIAALPPRGVLINVARAALVDTAALAARLRQGDLFAAIDVFDQEPLPAEHPLRGLPNAYLSPHRAGGLMESVQRIVGWLVDDIEAFLAGRPRAHALTEKMIPALDA